MNTPVREGETIEGSGTMRNRPSAQVLKFAQELLNEHVLEIDPSTIDYERVTDYLAGPGSCRP